MIRPRYYLTTEAAKVLGLRTPQAAWQAMVKHGKLQPLGRDGRELVWRAVEVEAFAAYRARYSPVERMRFEAIRRGIARRKAKRLAEASANG